MNGFSVRPGIHKDKVSVGVLGVDSGCGATHLVLALANYLRSGLGRKTAVIELSGKNELKGLLEMEGKVDELLGIKYYFGNKVNQIPELYNQGYEAYVLDLGTDYGMAREEFLRCDTKIIIGSISPWKVAHYVCFLNKIIKEEYENWEFLTLFGNRHDKRKIEKRYGIRMVAVPFLENPFYLKREDIAFLQKII